MRVVGPSRVVERLVPPFNAVPVVALHQFSDERRFRTPGGWLAAIDLAPAGLAAH
jgi:hypothetical protein